MLLYATSKFASIPLSHCVTTSPPPPFEAGVINLWPLKIKKRKKDRIKKVTNSIYRSIFLIYVGRGHFVGTTSQERGVFCCGEGGCVRKVLQDVGNHPPCLRSDVYYCTEHLWCWTTGNKTTLLHAFNWLYTYWRVDFSACCFRVLHEDFRRRRRRLLWSWGIRKANSPKQNWKITRQVVLYFTFFILEIVLFCIACFHYSVWSDAFLILSHVFHDYEDKS